MSVYIDPNRHKRRIAMWVAVSVTMIAIVAIWSVVLPVQLDGNGQSLFGDPAISRHSESARKTFEDGLKSLDSAWKEVITRQAAAAEEKSIVQAVNDLKTKIIEDAVVKESRQAR